jgi:hypothetical protein
MSPPDGADAVREIVGSAVEITPEPPRPLVREFGPADPFPVDALGTVLGGAVRAINDRVQAPFGICGNSVLGAATLAVQAHADVVLPTGHARPVSNFFVTIAATGDRKTACDADALTPIRNREQALREKHDTDWVTYINDKAAWEAARAAALKGNKKDRYAMRADLDALGSEPSAPLIPILTCPDPTYEGLHKVFADGQPSLGLFSAEAGQFIGGYGMSQDNKVRTAAGLSAAWDGEPMRRVRASDGWSVLPGRRLAVHLMAQPDVAGIMLHDPMLANQGLLSRLLVTAPNSIAGTRLWRDPSPSSEPALKRYGARLAEILEIPLPLAPGKTNELNPRRLSMSPEARVLWIAFVDKIELDVRPGGALEPVRGLANKLPEHAARLASVLALVDNVDAGEISSEYIQAGIVLAQHYAAEALRWFGGSRLDPLLISADRTRLWLLNDWPQSLVSLPDIYQLGPNSVRDANTAQKVIDVLVEHGWLVEVPGGAIVAGKRRRDVWKIVGQT